MKKCKVCDSNSNFIFSKEITEKKSIFNYYLCSECSFLFSDGMDNFTEKEYKKWYKYPEYLKYDNAGQSEYRRYRALRERELVHPKSKKILIYGAGATEVEKNFKELELDVYSTYSEYKEQNCNIEPALLPRDYFDLIICNEVAEHWVDPHYEFSIIEKSLSRKGIFIGSTGIVDNQLKKAKLEDWIYLNYQCLHAGHVTLWSWKALDVMSKKYNLINKSMQGSNEFRKGMRVGITQAFIILEKP